MSQDEETDLQRQLDVILRKIDVSILEKSYDGYRYLYTDWKIRLNEQDWLNYCPKCNYAVITIRCLGENDCQYILKNLDNGLKIELFGSIPFFKDVQGSKKPGEIVVTVGI